VPDFDAEGFVAAVEQLGLLLTAVRLADGTVRLNRWRTPDAVIHAQRIEALWAADLRKTLRQSVCANLMCGNRLPIDETRFGKDKRARAQ
jgi:hypothetical protein